MSALAAIALVQHHARAPGVDYAGVFLAAGLSWTVAIPGLAEAALIAAGISAANGHLELAAVLAVAFAGAVLGASAGWLIGKSGGRGLITARGPLLRLRLSLLARGDRFYERYGRVAVFFTPAWMAGIHGMKWSRFQLSNAVSALIWAVSIGVGAYLLGPSIEEVAQDAGLAGAALLVIAVVLAGLLVRRRRPR